MKHSIPLNLSKLITALHDAGYEAYIAGGAVRDMVLGLQPLDYDIATSAKPDEVIELLKKNKIYVVEAAKKFGTLMALFSESEAYEITTFRKEGPYSDARRPDTVEFVTAREDAKRRDFTVNGMFYDLQKNKIIDYVGGKEDVEKHILRCIGDPKKRLEEDHLRILRYIRLRHALRFAGDPETDLAIRLLFQKIRDVSWERIRDEFHKAFSVPFPHMFIRSLDDYNMLDILLPEVKAMQGITQGKKYHSEGDAYAHTLLALSHLPEDASIPLIWATLLHDIGKTHTQKIDGEKVSFYGHELISAELAQDILKRFRIGKRMSEEILFAVSKHMMTHQIQNMRPGKQIALARHPHFPTLFALYLADLAASVPADPSVRENDGKKREYLEQLYQAQHERNYPPLLLTGDDLTTLGMKPGPKFKEIINEAQMLQLEGKIRTKKEALDFVKKNYYKV